MNRDQVVEKLSAVAEMALENLHSEMMGRNYKAVLEILQIVAFSTTMLTQVTGGNQPPQPPSFGRLQ